MTEITDPLSDPRKNEAAWRALDLVRAYAAATVPRACRERRSPRPP
ncbi:hypothetical protein M2163_000328 [Streptomyces sp. SAI-135]|jgi:hypothetical protein|nr:MULTISPECIES: hypothetical protein [unclassified Streptomyces]MDH6523166.1 hypothetical protein [Streptomyces sp. SAI-090]MDH6574051.1 hypothetical protein [Streptomyces sp. SAI-117]MDH6581213.1 hypothetical protein [Streptomyces sp. SAI-133]MDH6613220.1 hypothetical protein [Streptomyces sp. SAI-135]